MVAIHNATENLHLFDLQKAEQVFHSPCFHAYYEFNKDDELVFASSSWPQEGIEHLELKHWQPGQNQPVVIHSRMIFPSSLEGRRIRSPSASQGLSARENGTVHAILSPDASLWFVPRVEADHIGFDVIEAVTGKVKYRADFLIGWMKKDTQNRSIYAEFSYDGNCLLTQLCDADANSIDLRVHDINTGIPLKLAMQYQGTEPWRIATFTGQDVYGISHHDGIAYLHHLTENAYRKLLLKETVLDVVKSAKAPNFILEQAELHQLKFTVQAPLRLIYSWMQTKSMGFGTGLGYAASVAGSHYAVRDLQNGKLIHHGTLYTGDEVVGESSFGNNPAILCCFLPNQGLLLLESPPKRQPWQTKLEEWRSKNVPWCFPLFPKVDRYRNIDGRTGATIAQFSLNEPSSILHASCSSGSKCLTLVTCEDKEEIVIRQFPFPLRLPWHIMLGWTALVFVTLSLLQTALAAWRNRRKLAKRT